MVFANSKDPAIRKEVELIMAALRKRGYLMPEKADDVVGQVEPINSNKARVFRAFHHLTDCHQACLSYFELGELRQSLTIAMECRSDWDNLVGLLEQLFTGKDKLDA